MRKMDIVRKFAEDGDLKVYELKHGGILLVDKEDGKVFMESHKDTILWDIRDVLLLDTNLLDTDRKTLDMIKIKTRRSGSNE